MKSEKKPALATAVLHPIAPVFNEYSETLILGSFPSVRSRQEAFFYAHPQNRFWRTIAAVYDSPVPESREEKIQLILSNRLALWDVIASCEIAGSSDSSIASVEPTDLLRILEHAPIRRIFVNGKTAEKFYRKYQLPKLGIEAIALPSTSSANAACPEEKLLACWKQLREAF